MMFTHPQWNKVHKPSTGSDDRAMSNEIGLDKHEDLMLNFKMKKTKWKLKIENKVIRIWKITRPFHALWELVAILSEIPALT